MAEHVIRIFSDLHYRDHASRLQSLDALRPLLDGADEIILNGDCLDTQTPSTRVFTEEVRAFFRRAAPHVTFIRGNHDPDLAASIGELNLDDGRVWITHGDVLFPDIAPWGRDRAEIVRRLAPLLAGLSAAEQARIETRLRLHARVALNLPQHGDITDRHLGRRLLRLASVVFPPNQVIAMLRVWRDTPRLADALASAQRPAARIVILGHTHYPGVWTLPSGRVVINTGSFCPPFGGTFVELTGRRVCVIRIAKHADGFRPGRLVAEFPLANPVASPLTATA